MQGLDPGYVPLKNLFRSRIFGGSIYAKTHLGESLPTVNDTTIAGTDLFGTTAVNVALLTQVRSTPQTWMYAMANMVDTTNRPTSNDGRVHDKILERPRGNLPAIMESEMHPRQTLPISSISI